MSWRLARSLVTLRDQVDRRYPLRSRASDGTIGDAAHATRDSDHNAWYGPGIVTAMDITHDPAHGVDIDRITDELAASRDSRIKYIIANGWILDSRSGNNPWKWMPYKGTNEHRKHLHLSVMPNASCDDPRLWDLPSFRINPPEEPMALSAQEIRQIADAVLDTPIPREGSGMTGSTNLRKIVAWSDFAWTLGRQASGTAAAEHAGPSADEIRQIVREELAATQPAPDTTT